MTALEVDTGDERRPEVMPAFVVSRCDPSAPAKVLLRHLSGKEFQLAEGFGYWTAKGAYIDIPRQEYVQESKVSEQANDKLQTHKTDLASVPSLLWGVLAPFGDQLRPALLHDRLCDLSEELTDREGSPDERKANKAQARIVRYEADQLFHSELRNAGVNPLRSRVFWAGVSIDRYCRYNRAFAFALIALVGIWTIGLVRAGGQGLRQALPGGGRPDWHPSHLGWQIAVTTAAAVFATTALALVARCRRLVALVVAGLVLILLSAMVVEVVWNADLSGGELGTIAVALFVLALHVLWWGSLGTPMSMCIGVPLIVFVAFWHAPWPALSDPRWLLAGPGFAVAVSIIWLVKGRGGGVALIGFLAVPVVLPILVVSVSCTAVLLIPDQIAWCFARPSPGRIPPKPAGFASYVDLPTKLRPQ